jgi:beta-lactamase class A
MPSQAAVRSLAVAMTGLVLLACAGSSSPSADAPPPASDTPQLPPPTATAPPEATTVPAPTSTPAPPSPATPPSPTPIPEQPVVEVAAPISELEETLAGLVDAYWSRGEFAVAVTDLQTGETVGVDLDRRHLSACSINFFVLLQATIDVQDGRYEEPLVGDLIRATTWSSNPVTARELYRIAGDGDVLAGVERVADLARELGGAGITLDHPPLFAAESLGADRNNWVTPRAMNEALRATYSGDVLKGEWLDYLLEAMTAVKPGLNYLMAVGPESPVSHKNGFFQASDGSWVDNDVAIVRFEQDGADRAYAISFFSQGVPEKYGDVALGQQLSTAAWAFFQRRYPPAGAAAARAGRSAG